MGKGANSIDYVAGAATRRKAKAEPSALVNENYKAKQSLSRSSGTVQRVPTERPPFGVKELRQAIPPHCFQRSLLRSSLYLLTDLLLVSLLLAMAVLLPPHLPTWAQCLFWPAYWYLQGAFMTGCWVIAHECGHQAFSPYGWLNDAVGFLVHSALLVPYFSWKYSHARHHKSTGNLSKDEVFIPTALESPVEEAKAATWHNSPLYRLGTILVALTVGWPAYLLFNASGRPYPRWASHFDPWSPIFSPRQRAFIALSDLGLAAACTALYALAQRIGALRLFLLYGMPYLVTNLWLVMITLLQHSHKALPHYNDAEWDWVRGALTTVDRSYGWFLNMAHHHIADTHVCHHLFSELPHYHAEEATAALRKVLGSYYLRDDRWIWRALWEDMRECRYVAPDRKGEGVLWYRK